MFLHKTIKNCIVLFLMALVSLPSFYSVYLYAKKQAIRREMKEKLEREALTTVRIHNDSVIWIEAGKEILVSNRMFDIKTATQEGDYVIFSGLYDDEEKAIESKMEKNTEENSSSVKLMKLISHLNFVPYENICTIPSIDFESRNKMHSWTEALVKTDRQIVAPPPKL